MVKNVTGYDMCKLQAGAYGTLSVLAEATLKVMPRPETACTILLQGMADEIAIPELSRALNTPYEVSAAAHLPAPVARRSDVASVSNGLGAVTALRLEGPAPSVAYRADAIEALLGHGMRLDAVETARFWAEIAEAQTLLEPDGRCVWRLCPTPTFSPLVMNVLRARFASAEGYYDWGGGLIWLSLEAGEAGRDGGASAVRAATIPAGGHATLVVASDDVRAATAVFEPLQGPLATLTRRVKSGFDPRGVLNPGRMHEGQ